MQSSTDSNDSKKRKANEISDNVDYSSMNQILAELYHERKRLRTNENNHPLDDNKIRIIENDKDLQKNCKEETTIQIPLKQMEKAKSDDLENKDISKEKAKLPLKPLNKPTLFLNKLRYYPKDFLLDNMVSFKEMMYPDLLKGLY